MANSSDGLLLDSPSWQTTAMIYWKGELPRLQKFVTSNTFVPHWQEFDTYWLTSGHKDIKESPPPREMIEQCVKEWTSGRNDYYLLRPMRTMWKDKLGLGHYVRLLSMIVRENMAVNGVWKITQEERLLEGYFTEAFALVNCMRDEWSNKGKLFEYLVDPKLGLWVHEVPFDRKNHCTNPVVIRTVDSSADESTKPMNSSIEQSKPEGDIAIVSSINTNSKSESEPPLYPTSDVLHELMANLRNGPFGNGLQIKGTAKHPEDDAIPFLDSLGEELSQKKVEPRHNDIPDHSPPVQNVTMLNSKRPASSEGEPDPKRSKSVMPEPVWHGRFEYPQRPTHELEAYRMVQSPITDSTNLDRHIPKGPRNSASSRPPMDIYRPNTESDLNFGRQHHEEPAFSRRRSSPPPSTLRNKDRPLPQRPYDLSTLSHAAQEMRRVKHMQELRNGFGVNSGPMIEMLKLICPFDLKGEACRAQPCKMWKICPVFDAGKSCVAFCPLAHVLRSCRAYAPSGRCKHDLLANPHLCAGWGHETYRRDPWARPARYHL